MDLNDNDILKFKTRKKLRVLTLLTEKERFWALDLGNYPLQI